MVRIRSIFFGDKGALTDSSDPSRAQSSAVERSRAQSSAVERSRAQSSAVDRSRAQSSAVERSRAQSSAVERSRTQSSAVERSRAQSSAVERSRAQSSAVERSRAQSSARNMVRIRSIFFGDKGALTDSSEPGRAQSSAVEAREGWFGSEVYFSTTRGPSLTRRNPAERSRAREIGKNVTRWERRALRGALLDRTPPGVTKRVERPIFRSDCTPGSGVARSGLLVAEGEAAVFEEGADFGGAAVEVLEEFGGIFGAAAGEYFGAEQIAVFAFEAAVGVDPTFGVAGEDVTPQVGVVAGGVAVREDV